jgi:hypothetical protein
METQTNKQVEYILEKRTKVQLGEKLGITPASIRNKLKGVTKWTKPEKEMISTLYFLLRRADALRKQANQIENEN